MILRVGYSKYTPDDVHRQDPIENDVELYPCDSLDDLEITGELSRKDIAAVMDGDTIYKFIDDMRFKSFEILS